MTLARMLPTFVENCFECPFFQGTTYLGGKCGRLEAQELSGGLRVTGYGIPYECPLRGTDEQFPLIPRSGD